MVANRMYDPTTHKHFVIGNNSDPEWWNGGEPLWVTALDSGYKTAVAMWPGSDVSIHNRRPTHFFKYDSHVTFEQRLGNLTKWLLGSEKVKSRFMLNEQSSSICPLLILCDFRLVSAGGSGHASSYVLGGTGQVGSPVRS